MEETEARDEDDEKATELTELKEEEKEGGYFMRFALSSSTVQPFKSLEKCSFCAFYKLCATYIYRGCPAASSLYHVMTSKNCVEARGWLRKITYPSLNFIMADKKGNIGHVSTGAVAKRGVPEEFDGTAPIPGW